MRFNGNYLFAAAEFSDKREAIDLSVEVVENGEYVLEAPEGKVYNKVSAKVAVPFKEEQIKTIDLNFKNGNMQVPADADKVMASVIIPKPATLLPENIAEGIEIAGIVGTHVGGSADVRYVTFMNGNTELYRKPVAVGDDCVDVYHKGLIEMPTKESTAQYNYVFYGWGASDGGAADGDILKNITEDKTVYAVFSAVVRTYTITWLDEDGTTVLKTEQVAYGAVPSYAPQKDGVGVDKWTPEPVAVTDNASYIVTWASLLDFASMSWSDIDAAVKAGKAKLFVLGATKTYVEPKYNYECIAQIVGIEQDDLADGSGKAGLTIASEKASSPNTSKWTTSADYTMDWLSSTPQTGSTFAKSMTSSSFELKTIAKLVKKTHYAADGTYQSNDVQWFIPSRREITGEGYDEGEQYQYYADGWVGKLLAAKLWTRTKQSYSTGKVYYLSNTSTTQSTAQQNATTTCSAVTYFCI